MNAIIQPQLDLQTAELKRAALILRAVNHSLRINMLNLIHESGAITVTELYTKLHLEQSVASQHLAILRRAGFVRTERKGKCIFYKINYEKFADLNEFISRLLN